MGTEEAGRRVESECEKVGEGEGGGAGKEGGVEGKRRTQVRNLESGETLQLA